MPDSFPSRLGLSPLDGPGQRRFVVIDETVDEIYGQRLEDVSSPASVLCGTSLTAAMSVPNAIMLMSVSSSHLDRPLPAKSKVVEYVQYFQHHNVEYELVKLPTREEHKTFDLVFEVAARLEKFKLNR